MVKKYVLVSLEDLEDSKNATRNLRRYLTSHNFKFLFSSEFEEMGQFLEKNSLNDFELDQSTQAPSVRISSNQEILEIWARQTFPEDSDEMRLLLGTQMESDDDESNGTSSPNDFDSETTDSNAFKITDIFANHNNNNNNNNDSDGGKKEKDDELLQFCGMCNHDVEVGKNRNTKIKRQAQHVVDVHPEPEFHDVNIYRRYQCLQCQKVLPVMKSPCEHISDSHSMDSVETEFADMWTKEQLAEFNAVLERCFGRHLPVPRSRRIRIDGDSFVIASKAPYRIKQGDEVVQIETVAERTRPPSTISSGNSVKEDGFHPNSEPIEENLVEMVDGDEDQLIYIEDDE